FVSILPPPISPLFPYTTLFRSSNCFSNHIYWIATVHQAHCKYLSDQSRSACSSNKDAFRLLNFHRYLRCFIWVYLLQHFSYFRDEHIGYFFHCSSSFL